MTEPELRRMLFDFNEELNRQGAALICCSVAIRENDNCDLICTSFNPHFRQCRCSSCKDTVALAKLQVNNTDEFGKNLTESARRQ